MARVIAAKVKIRSLQRWRGRFDTMLAIFAVVAGIAILGAISFSSTIPLLALAVSVVAAAVSLAGIVVTTILEWRQNRR